MLIESTLSYNNSKYGKGKAYIAKLTGLDPKWGFKREFLPRDVDYSNSSKTTWYSYSWDVEDGLYEMVEQNSYKNKRIYFIVNGGEYNEISRREAKEILEGGEK